MFLTGADGTDVEGAIVPSRDILGSYTGHWFSNLVHRMGALEYAIKPVIRELDVLSYTQLIFKSHSASSIMAFNQWLKTERRERYQVRGVPR